MYERPKRCQNCYFFQQGWKKVRKISQFRRHVWDEYEKEDYGICRRYPPQLVTYTHNSTGSRLPKVDEDSFCGEWKEQTFDFFDANV